MQCFTETKYSTLSFQNPKIMMGSIFQKHKHFSYSFIDILSLYFLVSCEGFCHCALNHTLNSLLNFSHFNLVWFQKGADLYSGLLVNLKLRCWSWFSSPVFISDKFTVLCWLTNCRMICQKRGSMPACIHGGVMADNQCGLIFTICWVNLKSPLCPTEIEFPLSKQQQSRGTQ